MRTSTETNNERTFRSGAYLDTLFRSAEKMDQRLQEEICARIKQARIEAGFTQEEAADTLGVTMRGYQNYESIRVPFRKLSRIAEVFGVPEAWLLRGEPPREEEYEAPMEEIRRRLGSLEAQVSDAVSLMRRALELLGDAPVVAGDQAPDQATGTDG